jgi:putative tryptophan/tyrosine transport system substrate-binding protein
VTAASAFSACALAQTSGPVKRIAVIMGFPEGDPTGQANIVALRQKLEGLGWVENRNLRIDYRWPGGDLERTRIFAKELIALAPSVIVTSTNQVTETVRGETQTIPIVFASLGDPVGSGLVKSLSRPGGNVTGFPVFVEDMGSKWLELLREVDPRIERVGFVYHPDAAPHRGLLRAAQAAAPAFGIKLTQLAVHNAAEIEAAITGFGRGTGGALAVPTHAVSLSNRALLIGLAAKHGLPTVFGEHIFVESGGLVSYGSDQIELFRGAATYVDLILKGANPAELPVQLPTKFNLIINLKTAKALGITVPSALLVRADSVIE